MKQRIVIAMALATDPDLLIADELTTAVDVTTQPQILDLLAELQDERGMAVAFVTHDLGRGLSKQSSHWLRRDFHRLHRLDEGFRQPIYYDC
jgi:ABC-type microcin C transport system duplicated ATPase subunit YejF